MTPEPSSDSSKPAPQSQENAELVEIWDDDFDFPEDDLSPKASQEVSVSELSLKEEKKESVEKKQEASSDSDNEADSAVAPAIEKSARASKGSSSFGDVGALLGSKHSSQSQAKNTKRNVRRSKSLTTPEKVSFLCLLILLLVGGCVVFLFPIYDLSKNTKREKEVHFPVQGHNFQILSAESYWREPTSDGGNTTRRGTILLPVLELTTTGGPAEIWVFFRNDAGEIIGDSKSCNISGKGTFVIPATAGFEDTGAYAAYRTRTGMQPWKIEVREQLLEKAGEEKSRLLFEMNISAQRK